MSTAQLRAYATAISATTSNRLDVANAVEETADLLDLLPRFEGASTGSNNDYELSFSPAYLSYNTNQIFRFVANHTNTGVATLDIDGIGQKDIVYFEGTALVGGEIQNGRLIEVFYDGTDFIILNPAEVLAAGEEVPTSEIYDGKIVYRKVIDTGILPNTSTKTIAHEIAGLDWVFRAEGMGSTGVLTIGTAITIPYPHNANNTVEVTITSTSINIITNANYTNINRSFVTLWYTKT